MNKEEIKLLDIQLIATLFFIGSLMLSYFLTYNDKFELIYNKRLISEAKNYKLSVFNRTLVVIISLVFLYTNYKDKQIAKNKNEATKSLNLQIAASELNIIAALIVLYVVISSGEYSITTTVGNPNL